jgi:hypothetical protein
MASGTLELEYDDGAEDSVEFDMLRRRASTAAHTSAGRLFLGV